MHRAIVSQDGSIQLGQQAISAGYTPGTVVDVIVTRAGSLILAVDQSPPALDVTFRPLVGGAARLALRQGRRRVS